MIETVRKLKMTLFSGPQKTAFTILDGATVPDLVGNLRSFNTEHFCLYQGNLEPDMAEVAPYLANLEQESEFTEWVLREGWGKHWGIFGTADSDIASLKKHFRKFTMVYDEDGKTLYFRYYDPRVSRAYLPTCSAEELRTFFGPVVSFIIEGNEASTALKHEVTIRAAEASIRLAQQQIQL